MPFVGTPAPQFDCVAYIAKEQPRRITLAEQKGKWVVLFFYPRDFTFICPTELKGFAAARAEFEKNNAVLIAASTDSEWSHQAWFERDLPEVTYPVLADSSHAVSRDYGVLIENTGEALRGTFIIDPEGVLRYVLISDLSVGRSVDETLRVLQALQTGERCPLNWKPGQATV